MRMLNKKASKTLTKLIKKMNDGYLKIINGSYMPLSLEKISDLKNGFLLSLGHHSVQNGDLMYDPEVVVCCTSQGEYYATSFKNDYMGMNQESVLFEDGQAKSLRARQQKDHTVFLGQWLENIKNQGFLEVK